jgi:predicted RNase H-like HicB family nuclease
MKREFTAIIEKATECGYWAWCPEISGSNGQGETVDETRENLKEAIKLILKDQLEESKIIH